METENDFWIPRNLDASPLFLVWEMDIAVVYIVWMLLGFILGTAWLGVVFALVFGRVYTRLKEDGGTGLMMKIVYWYTPCGELVSKNLPSHIREYIGG